MTAALLTANVRQCICGACFDQSDWTALAIIDRVEPAEVQGFLAAWPDGDCIEIRRCEHCSAGIVAKVAHAPCE